jgi:hypothetical protein
MEVTTSRIKDNSMVRDVVLRMFMGNSQLRFD